MEQPNEMSPERLDDALTADHLRHEQTFSRVLGALAGGDPDAIRASWRAMEAELEAHMQAEEQYILPYFKRAFPYEAMRVRMEHAEIRECLEKLGVDLDLHALSEEAAAEFIHKLQQHAHFEERALYNWAQARLAASERSTIVQRLRGASHTWLEHAESVLRSAP